MPKHPDSRSVGRPRKAHRHDVVRFREKRISWDGGPVYLAQTGVIVGWKSVKRNTWYKVQRITTPMSGKMFGQAIWVPSHLVRPIRNPNAKDGRPFKYKRAWGTGEANKRLGGSKVRGCYCNCCVHVAVGRREILEDGSFRFEAMEDEEE